MIDKAIAKITDEMMKSDNPAIRAIEEHLTQKCTTDTVAKKILSENKTLKGALEEMRKVAKQRAIGGVGVLSDAEGYEIVDKYFGIENVKTAPKKETVNILDFI